MAPRSSWKGFLRLSLVSVPVKAFTATNSSEEIRLNQLHKECNSRVRYLKVCPEHGELKSDDIVSGFEYVKDQYVIVEQDEIQKLRSQSDKAIGIEGFIDPDAIDSVHLTGRTYYLAPDGPAGKKPFALLHRGMDEKGLVAVASMVLGGREQMVMVRPVENLLAMTVLSYSKKIKPIDQFTEMQEEQDLSDDEVKLADTLIAASTKDEFDFAEYKDRYVENLQKVIQLKVDGQEIVEAKDHEEPKILNLMDALKKSVAEAQAAQTGEKKPRKTAPSSKKTAKKSSSKKKSG